MASSDEDDDYEALVAELEGKGGADADAASDAAAALAASSPAAAVARAVGGPQLIRGPLKPQAATRRGVVAVPRNAVLDQVSLPRAKLLRASAARTCIGAVRCHLDV